MRNFAAFFIWHILRQLISLSNLLSKFLSCYCLHFTMSIAYNILEMLVFYADEVLVMGRCRNSCVFNFVILLAPNHEN